MNKKLPSVLTDPRIRPVLFWPIYTVAFTIIENVDLGRYTVIYSRLDDLIPFCEFFVVPYFLWYPFWIGMLVFCLVKDKNTFSRTMWYFILTFTFALAVYIVFPSQQDLRPASFANDNFCTAIIGGLYRADINRNVLPSEHVLGALAVVFASFDSALFSKVKRVLVIIMALVIIASVVFIKQHSVLDVIAALPVSAGAYFVCFFRGDRSLISKITLRKMREAE